MYMVDLLPSASDSCSSSIVTLPNDEADTPRARSNSTKAVRNFSQFDTQIKTEKSISGIIGQEEKKNKRKMF
jgi:hypothetical protein